MEETRKGSSYSQEPVPEHFADNSLLFTALKSDIFGFWAEFDNSDVYFEQFPVIFAVPR